jgi:uncharacterized membrane protein
VANSNQYGHITGREYVWEYFMRGFIKTTIVGGVIFLLPVVLVLLVLSHAMRFAGKVVQPISHSLHFDHTVAGVGVATLLASLLLVIASFAAGVVARTKVGHHVSGWFESSLLGNLPQYQLAKSMGEGLAQIEGTDNLKPALISIDGGWQIGYLLEPIENGWMAVFVPQAPTPMSGNVMYLPADRIRPMAISMMQARAIVKHIGFGSGAALRGTNLTPPAE